ncbi:NAD(P)-binding protein [Mollisia scopiformis]|uniref:Probable quinone oxidoreductase n=1 Tax=Mollisia scopiformis TaxID=149040 RepID=A0A194X5D2_MOLSC|nr:NAD(P)-binding protein [Mollisia scopiformis]KUJ15279.1 NAD(P)-binding protein [Mollisia scopiformis]
MASNSIPSIMKGVVIEKTGGPDVLQYKTDLPVPVPKDGEVLVKNEFIGINFIDINFRSGLYPIPLPYIPGVEAEGTIVSTSSSGQIYNLKPGDRVAYIGNGTYAEYSACPASKVYPLPPNLEPSIAAAAISQGVTALTFINKSYHVQKDDWILVQGAAGGVGLWLCQLLRAVGAKVIGTARTDEKMKLAKKNGAEFVLNYSTEDVAAKVMDITGGKGVAAVFDSIGLSTFSSSLQALAQDGTMVSIGNTSGAVPPFKITDLSAKNLRLLKPSVFGYLRTREEFVRWAERLFGLVAKDEELRKGVKGMVWKTYELQDAAKAHGDLEGRKSSGKLLLRV